MDSLENHGIILRELRKRARLSIQKAANRIGRSTGWICEIENGHGTSRLSSAEFERIVKILGGSDERHMFKTWIANHKNLERTNRLYDGAVLKFIRIKKGLSLTASAQRLGFSKGYLSKLETGVCPISLECRNKIMLAYGYSPSSFKNLSTDPVRSKSVPSRFKFQILFQKFSHEQAEKFFDSTLAKLQSASPQL